MEPPRDADLYSAFLQALNLSRAFDSWDRFDHEGAKKILSSYSAIIGKAYSSYFQTVQLLTKEGSGKEPALIYDLWLNALRRAAQGRYDDAVARIYRVIEWTAQWILKDQCGVDSSDLPEDFIPGHIKIIRGHKNKYQAPLYIAWQLVEEKTDTCLASFFRDNGKDLLGKLDIRNASILAHGFVPIDSGKWENFYGWMEQWFWPCFLQDAKKSGLKKMPPQLPDYYSFDI
jgi:CRISPR-associated protein (TIGR02710 family)